MSASRNTDPRSPFSSGRPALYLVGPDGEPADGSPAPLRPPAHRSFEEPPEQMEIAEPVADIIPANRSMAPVTVSVPTPIRWLAKLIAAIRWFPTAWTLLCSIPSEARQAWKSAFGDKQE